MPTGSGAAGAGPGAHRGGPTIWSLLGVAAVLALAGLFFRELKRMESRVNRLAGEMQHVNSRLAEVEQRAQTAAQQASQAAQSARAAATERDQAQLARSQAATQARQSEQQAAEAEQKAEGYRREREQELTRLQQALGQIAETRRTAMGVVMTLGSESVRFDFDKADIKPQYRETLSRIAGILSTLKGYSIYVYGYTDDVGTQEYNLGLSERRARAVRDYLVSSGINSTIMTARGFGKSNPRVPGDTPQARAKNRRVEIGIVDSTLRVEEIVPSTR
jgi:outer membrane protein OmpA-like peptidoglycan-associated protein